MRAEAGGSRGQGGPAGMDWHTCDAVEGAELQPVQQHPHGISIPSLLRRENGAGGLGEMPSLPATYRRSEGCGLAEGSSSLSCKMLGS